MNNRNREALKTVSVMMRQEGKSIRHIARALSIHRQTVKRLLREAGLNVASHPETEAKSEPSVQSSQPILQETENGWERSREATPLSPGNPSPAIKGKSGQPQSPAIFPTSTPAPGKRPPKKRPSKLDPHRSRILELAKTPNITNKRILETIRQEGYTGGKTILDDFLREVRKQRRARRAYIRYEPPPGREAQMDWSSYRIAFPGESGAPIHVNVHIFSIILSYSRYQYLEAFLDEKQDTLFQGHVEAFRYFGGVPAEILYDNQKAVVLGRLGGKPIIHPRFQSFAEHYGFTPKLCLPFDPERKGRVERTFRYLNTSFFPGRKFIDLHDFRRQLRDWLESARNADPLAAPASSGDPAVTPDADHSGKPGEPDDTYEPRDSDNLNPSGHTEATHDLGEPHDLTQSDNADHTDATDDVGEPHDLTESDNADHTDATDDVSEPHEPDESNNPPSPSSETDANDQAAENAASTAGEQTGNYRIHGTTRERPVDRWAKEKPLLIALPPVDFLPTRIEQRPVAPDCTIPVLGNHYTVPPDYVDKIVTVAITPKAIHVFNDRRRLIAQHLIPQGKGKTIINEEHYDQLRKAKKRENATAIEKRFLTIFPDAQPFLDGLQRRVKSLAPIHLRQVDLLLERFTREQVRQAIQLAMEHGTCTAPYIEEILRRQFPSQFSARPFDEKLEKPSGLALGHLELGDAAYFDNIFPDVISEPADPPPTQPQTGEPHSQDETHLEEQAARQTGDTGSEGQTHDQAGETETGGQTDAPPTSTPTDERSDS